MALVEALEPACERVAIAGSLRRCLPRVGDIEIVYVPKIGPAIPEGKLFEEPTDLAARAIVWLESAGVFERRLNVNGSETFGPKNKLLRHCPSGIPVDLFATDARCWFNYLVCRTGPASFNIRVAQRARELGWMWHPYGDGFSRSGSAREITSEEDLFQFLGWPFLEPWERA